MSRGYTFAHAPVSDAVGGDPTTGTVWGLSFEDAQDALLNTVLAKIDADVSFLMGLTAASGTDTLSYSWTSVDAITVAPGVAIADDGTEHTISAATVINLNSDLDTGTRAANSIYFVWIGTDATLGTVKLLYSLSYSTPPTQLLHAYRLKNWVNTNAANSNIEQFSAALPETWPIGETVLWASPYKPCGSFWAQGQALSRTHGASARIFAKLGVTWGVGDGSTTFNLPDTRGRSPMGSGQGSGLTNRVLGSALGEEGHALTLAENGQHTHVGGLHAHTGGLHTHPERGRNNTTSGTVGLMGCAFDNTTTTGATLSGGDVPTTSDGDVATSSSGSGTAHNTVHPVFVGGYIIKG